MMIDETTKSSQFNSFHPAHSA